MESFELLWVYDGTVEYAEGRRVGVDRLVLLRPGRRYIFSNDAGGRPARAVSIQFRIDVYPRVGQAGRLAVGVRLPDGDICRPLIHYLLAQRKRRDPLVVRPALSALIAAFVSGQVQTVAPAVRPLPKPLLARPGVHPHGTGQGPDTAVPPAGDRRGGGAGAIGDHQLLPKAPG